MPFNPNTDITPGDMMVIEMIKNSPAAIRQCIHGIVTNTDEYSRGLLGVLTDMLDFIERK